MEDSNLISELNKSVKAKLYDRLTDPLLGSFTLFLITVNWKFFYILIFSNKTAFETLEYFDKEYFKTCWNYLYFFGVPLAASLIYIFAYPWFKEKIFNFSYKRKVKLKNLKKSLEEDEILTLEEAREIKRKNNAVNESMKNELSSIRRNLDSFKTYILKQYAVINKIENISSLHCVIKKNDVELNDWVMIQNEEARKPSQYDNNTTGIVAEIINDTYCIVQGAGIVKLDKVDNLKENTLYMLSTVNLGKMVELDQDVKRRMELGQYLGNGNFSIDRKGFG